MLARVQIGYLNVFCYWQVGIVCWVIGTLQVCRIIQERTDSSTAVGRL
jgi:hypothetical protein